MAQFLHVSVPALLYVSVPALLYVSVPAQLLLARLHVSVPTSCSDFDLTLDKMRPTMSPLSYDFSFDSIRIRIHVPRKNSTIKTRFSFSPFPALFFFNPKIVKTSYHFFCFRFPPMRHSGIPLCTSSGAVAVASPGDLVHILDEREYRVLRINQHSSTVVLRRVDATAN